MDADILEPLRLSAGFGLDLRPEAPADGPAIEGILDRAFGPGRLAKTSERVRERLWRARPDLSRVAHDAHGPIGVCRIGEVGLDGRTVYFLGPLAVEPSLQGGGLGQALTAAAAAACRADGAGVGVVLVGAPAFFGPLGFRALAAARVTLPGPVDPKRVLGLGFEAAFEGLSGALARV